ncbi:VWA domain-containing protein [Streptomyces sp. ID05-39B]|uniref:vWA domain-containing protein n=1 Tax=Streptomyces sp. ID05-39B TaxID=3028664 RepID=UPI0029BF12AA|nr:VWA domain-containing protein [Streptomyces sp. ID05-39B]MDX3532182.1 VWA domain-containing protein [Streptomyces sp. ID05-39B]
MSEHTEEAVDFTAFKTKGLPAYLVLDTSTSMKPYERLLNETLLTIYDTLYTTPQLSEFIHLSVVSFNTMPHVVASMTDIEALESLPTVSCGGWTNVGPMCELLRARITEDVSALAGDGVQVLRPVVFLLTDGLPTDKPSGAWKQHLDALQDRSWKPWPHIITYGFGDASESVLSTIATAAAYIAEDPGGDNGEALSQAMSSLLNSLVASARAQSLQVPEEVAGYRTLPTDYVS